MDAEWVISIAHYPKRLELAKSVGTKVLDYRDVDVREALMEMTGGIGPDATGGQLIGASRADGKFRPRQRINDESCTRS